MSRYRAAYPPEFRRQMVELVRAGRSPQDLAEEFEPSAQAIRTWVKQAERDDGRRRDGPTSLEREELARLRREVRQLRQERDILAKAAGKRCKEAGVRPSMGSVGDAYDNAMCESFFATLECELLDRRRFRSHAEARMAIFTFIEGWYNPSRRHSGLGYLSPMDYETRSMIKLKTPTPNRPQNRENSIPA